MGSACMRTQPEISKACWCRVMTVRQIGLWTVQQCGMLSAGHAVNGSSMDGQILPMAALDVCRSAHPKLAFKKGECHGLGSQPKVS